MRTLYKIVILTSFLVSCALITSLTQKQGLNEHPTSSVTSKPGWLKNVTLTVLIDNNPNSNFSLNSPWGISIYIKTENANILFDAGSSSIALKENCEKLNVDLSTLDFVVISHEHGDHIQGLSYISQLKSNLTVYVPKHMSPSCKTWIRRLGFSLIEIESTTVILRGITIIGELYGPPYEQALAINIKDLGLIIFVGCSHPGVENLVAKAIEDLNVKPYAVMGGFHLSGVSLERIRSTAEQLIKLGLKKIYPIHCSGEAFRNFVKENYPNLYGDGGVGLKVCFGSYS